MIKHYWNEIDPYAAEWLRNLIAAGHLPAGDVDTRSIADVRPDDLKGYRQAHFFAGIGGWSLAARLAGWPDDRPLWTGSCPCQPFSAAGKRGGFDDERHLWPAFHHLIRECRPDVVAGEQVASKDGLAWLDLVHSDMEAEGYAFGAVDSCAAGVGAPHIRQRLYWVGKRVADAGGQGLAQRPFADVRRGTVRHKGAAVAAGELSGGLADADRGERDRLADGEGCQRDGATAGWVEGDGVAERGRADGGLADAARLAEPQVGKGHDAIDEQRTPVGRRAEQPAGRFQKGRAADGRNGTARGLGHAELVGAWRHAGAGAEAQGGPALRPERHDAGSPGPIGRPGPTNGLWRDADWLFCRDGKWRPVSPLPQSLVDGSAESLGRVRAEDLAKVEEEVNAWAMERGVDAAQALRDLLGDLAETARSCWTPGGIPGLHEAPFLLAFLRQLAAQGWRVAQRLPLSCAEVREIGLRSVRLGEGAAGSPRRHGLEEQRSEQSADAVSLLSSLLARCAREAWGDAYEAHAETRHPLAIGAKSRVGRLRAYGNAIVPQVAAEVIAAFMECRP